MPMPVYPLWRVPAGVFAGGGLLVRLEQRIELLGLDASHQVLVGVGPGGRDARIAPREGPIEPEELACDARRELGQHGRNQDAQQLETRQRPRAYGLKFCALLRILRENPGLVRIEVLIQSIRVGHDLAHRFAELACLVVLRDHRRELAGLVREQDGVAAVRRARRQNAW